MTRLIALIALIAFSTEPVAAQAQAPVPVAVSRLKDVTSLQGATTLPLIGYGLVVGLKIDHGEMFERLLEEETVSLEAGDLYVLFTDGISEAMNRTDDCFGEARLGQLLEDHADLPSADLRERVLAEIAAFVGGAPQHDDMTLILLRVEDVPGVMSPALELAVTARRD